MIKQPKGSYRQERRKQGLCAECGLHSSVAYRCEKCKEKHAASDFKAFRRRLAEAGLCRRCGLHPVTESCAKQLQQHQELRHERRRKGYCAECGLPSKRYRCAKCAEERNTKEKVSRLRLRAERRSMGLCGQCGLPSGESYRCDKCKKVKNKNFSHYYANNKPAIASKAKWKRRKKTELRQIDNAIQAEIDRVEAEALADYDRLMAYAGGHEEANRLLFPSQT